MYVTDDMIARMVGRYGQPQTAQYEIETPRKEFGSIRNSQKHGRSHDFTLYIFKGDKVIVNAKHFYPPGLYRAPSGGLIPDEGFRAGIAREAMEETGCEIELERFLLRTMVGFVNGSARIDWQSYVFRARYLAGDFAFTDRREIREVRLAELEEFERFSEIMRSSEVSGLHYRAWLHDRVTEQLQGLDLR
jgi:ADP-ribose pyrophosphatase YjhB (NUDIX family)